MPIIIDANRTGDFSAPMGGHAVSILTRIKNRRTKVAVGGKLLKELMGTKLSGLLAEWSRSGMLIKFDNAKVDDLETEISKLSILSDDPHVIALVRISGVRLVYTEDRALIGDLTNKTFVDPKCRVLTTRTPERHAGGLLERYSG